MLFIQSNYGTHKGIFLPVWMWSHIIKLRNFTFSPLKNSRKQISIFPMHAIQTLISINDMNILACLLKRSQENKRDFGNKKLSQKRDRQYLFMIIRFWTAVVPSLLTLSLPEYLMEFCKVSLTFESVDPILWCDHSNETSLPVLSHDAICFSKF